MDEGAPLLAVSAKMEHSNSAKMRARAGTFLLIFIASIFFILDCGLPISSASGQSSHSVSTTVVSPPPPCCHSGSLNGRRASEASLTCIQCPESRSGSSSSLVAAYDVFPSAPPQCPPHPALPHSNYEKTIGVKRWPAPKTPSGSPNWYRDDCGNDDAAGPVYNMMTMQAHNLKLLAKCTTSKSGVTPGQVSKSHALECAALCAASAAYLSKKWRRSGLGGLPLRAKSGKSFC